MNWFNLWNDGPRQKSHPYNLCPWYFALSEVTKWRSMRAARGQLHHSCHESSDAFAGASSLMQIKATCSESGLWSSRHGNATKSFRQSLAFPGPLPTPPGTEKGTRFQGDTASVPPMRRSRGSEVRGFLRSLICASILSCLAGLPTLPCPPLQFYLKSTPSFARKCCPECSWSRSGLWTSATCPALWQVLHSPMRLLSVKRRRLLWSCCRCPHVTFVFRTVSQ